MISMWFQLYEINMILHLHSCTIEFFQLVGKKQQNAQQASRSVSSPQLI